MSKGNVRMLAIYIGAKQKGRPKKRLPLNYMVKMLLTSENQLNAFSLRLRWAFLTSFYYTSSNIPHIMNEVREILHYIGL